jgi:hypothetical protein
VSRRGVCRSDEYPGEDPEAGEAYQAVHDTGRSIGLTEFEAKYGRHQVELGQGDQAPVDGSDPGKDPGSEVDSTHFLLLS